MRILLLGLLCLTGCYNVVLNSNDPDSGSSCPVSKVPAGSATLQGDAAFTVRSAYQLAYQTIPPDSGITSAQINVQLVTNAISCAERQDGGAVGPGLFVTVAVPGKDRVAAGTFPVQSAADGGAFFFGYTTADAGSQAVVDGTFTLASVLSCSTSGSFDLRLGSPDGGRSTLSGTFSSEYCK